MKSSYWLTEGDIVGKTGKTQIELCTTSIVKWEFHDYSEEKERKRRKEGGRKVMKGGRERGRKKRRGQQKEQIMREKRENKWLALKSHYVSTR